MLWERLYQRHKKFSVNNFQKKKKKRQNNNSGMRGAVAFALALHISIKNEETKRVLLTTTLVIVLFTIVFLGGTTLPVLRVNFLFSPRYKFKLLPVVLV